MCFPLISTRLRPPLARGGLSRFWLLAAAATSPSSAMSMLEREAASLPFTDEHQRAAYESRHRLERGMGVLNLRQGQISSRGTTVHDCPLSSPGGQQCGPFELPIDTRFHAGVSLISVQFDIHFPLSIHPNLCHRCPFVQFVIHSNFGSLLRYAPPPYEYESTIRNPQFTR